MPGQIGQSTIEVGVEEAVFLKDREVAAVDRRQIFALGVLGLRSLHMGLGPQGDEGGIAPPWPVT